MVDVIGQMADTCTEWGTGLLTSTADNTVAISRHHRDTNGVTRSTPRRVGGVAHDTLDGLGA